MPDLDLTDYVIDVHEGFIDGRLDLGRWWPYYNPHWASRERTGARYDVGGGLRLRIDVDTEPWSPKFDGDVRVSHLQTGQFSGPEGSGIGQHRFRDGLVVREEQPERRLWLVGPGSVIEARARAIRHPDAMVALWPIGFGERPEDSGEICLFEIFGGEMDDEGGLVGVGVKPQADPRLVEDFEKVRVAGDLTAFHDYAMVWDADRLRFFIDGSLVKTVVQRLDYPVQLMLDVYELPSGRPRDEAALPHVFEVAHVRSYRRR